MKNNITYKIYTLGCKVNQYDSGALSGKLNSIDFAVRENKADLVIINTCAVTQTAISKAKRMINKARQENPRAKIIITGCWPKVYKDEIKELKVDFIFGAGETNKLIKKVKQNFNIDAANKKQPLNKPKQSVCVSSLRSRYFIKIQDGCEQFCSYCIIPYARGGLQSRAEKDIIAEIREAVKIGYREIVLSGIHLGLYGFKDKKKDIGKLRLTRLLGLILKLENLGRVRLSSIELREINNELIKLIARPRDSGKAYICKHLHIPLQSGSDKILKLMNRPYSTEYFYKKIKKIRELIPDIAISTDIIVGFPGETDKDFKLTRELVHELKFSRLHVFPFSTHKKTPAASFPNQTGESIRAKRAKALRDIGKKLELEYRKKFVGKNLELIIENKKGNYYKGKTEFYFDILFSESDIAGRGILSAGDRGLIGKIIMV